MPTVEFARSLRRHVECAPQQVPEGSLREALEVAIAVAPGLARYVFDDQRSVRKHVAVFVNSELIHDRVRLDRAVAEGDKVLVVQALTGG
jgi:sulfur-carrier protein